MFVCSNINRLDLETKEGRSMCVFLKKKRESRQEERKREKKKEQQQKRKNSSASHMPIEQIEHGGLIVDVLIIQRWGVHLGLFACQPTPKKVRKNRLYEVFAYLTQDF